jgi:hypothetical protein
MMLVGLVLTGRAVMRSVCWHSPIVSVPPFR